MYRRLFFVFLVVFLISAACVSAPDTWTAPVNPEFTEYINSPPLETYGYIPSPVDSPQTIKSNLSEVMVFPTYYDLRVLNRMTPVKNQGSCGSCWAFASYGSMESESMPDTLLDLSENNLKNRAGFDYSSCAGGNAQMATAYLTRGAGPVSESDDPYVSSSTTSPEGLPLQEYVDEILTIPGKTSPLDNDNIKLALQDRGALYTSMFYSGTYYNTTHTSYYYNGTSGSNHAVTLAGWNDNYSKYNFTNTAPGDGAFIVKNSWGDGGGEKGYFYVSYYDTKIGKTVVSFNGNTTKNYDTIYQYDPLGWVSSVGFGSNVGWGANVFTSQSEETLTHIGVFTSQSDTNYQVYVYLDPSSGPIGNGYVSSTQGTLSLPGYHTIIISPVLLKENQKFSVVVRYQTPSYNYPITIEKPIIGYTGKAVANAGEGYISATGTEWDDLTSTHINTSVCIKAFTVGGTPIPPTPTPTPTPTIVPTPTPTITPTPTPTQTPIPVPPPSAEFVASPKSGTAPLSVTFTDQSTGDIHSYYWQFGDGYTSTEQNTVHTYTSTGIYTVRLTASGDGGSSTRIATNLISVTDIPTPTPTITPTPTQPPIPAILQAAFIASPKKGNAPLTVKFTDASIGNVVDWYWQFGDGEISTLENPVHIYKSAGVYSVSLRVGDLDKNAYTIKKNYIRVRK